MLFEVSTVTTGGTSGVLNTVVGMTEIQTITQSGSRSNVVAAGSPATVTINIAGATFETGSTQTYLTAPLAVSIGSLDTPTTVTVSSGGLAFPASGYIAIGSIASTAVGIIFEYTSRTDTVFTGTTLKQGTATAGADEVWGPTVTANDLGTATETGISWPSTAPSATTTVDGWTYQPAGATTFTENDYHLYPRLINNTGGTVDIFQCYFSVTITVADDMSGSTSLIPITINPSINTRDAEGSIVINALPDGVPRSGVVSFISGNGNELESGDFILWRLSTNTSVEYTVDSVSVYTVGAAGEIINASGFSLELDTGDTLSSTVPLLGAEPLTGFFGGDFNSSTALTSLRPLIEANWTGTTTEDVVSTSGTPLTPQTMTFNQKDETGTMRSNGWDIVHTLFNGGKRKGDSTSIDYTISQDGNRTGGSAGSWDHWVNAGVQKTWIGTDPANDAFKALLDAAIAVRADLVNTTLQLTANNNAAITATFVVTRVVGTEVDFNGLNPPDYWFEIDSFALDGSGNPIRSDDANGPVYVNHNHTGFGWTAVFTLGNNTSSSLTINTTSTGTVTSDWGIPSQGRGISGTTSFSNTSGTTGAGLVSTYRIFDYNSSTVPVHTFTGSVTSASTSDAAIVNAAIETFIDGTDQVPTNFTADIDGNDIVITAAEAIDVTGDWIITADHGTGFVSGTSLAYADTVVSPNGATAGTTGGIDRFTIVVNGVTYAADYVDSMGDGGLSSIEQANLIVAHLNATNN